MITKRKIFIITAENYSAWYERNLLEIAIRLSDQGFEVKYINVLGDSKNKDNSFVEAKNMDGEGYGFLMALTDTENAALFLEECFTDRENTLIISDCMLSFLKKDINPDILFSSLRCRQMNAYIYKKIMKRAPFLAIKGMHFADNLKKTRVIDAEDLRQKKLLTPGSAFENPQDERREYYDDIIKKITD